MYQNEIYFAKSICGECGRKFFFEHPLKHSNESVVINIKPNHHIERKRKNASKLRHGSKGSSAKNHNEHLILKNGPGRRMKTLNSIQIINSESILGLRMSEDEIYALRLLNNLKQFNNVIKYLQIFPDFVVIFSSKSQEKVLKSSKNYVLTMDSTGSLFKDPFLKERAYYEMNNSNNKPLFLYCAMLTNNGNTKTIPIMQCISQNHTKEGTVKWISTIFKDVNSKPNEIKVNASSMMISACNTYFNNVDTNGYLRLCYDSLDTNKKCMASIIRIDKSHIVKLISRWKLWNESKCGLATKLFYVNTLKKMTEEGSFNKIKDILRSLFIVMLSPIEGSLQSKSIQSISEYQSNNENVDEKGEDHETTDIKKEYSELIDEVEFNEINWYEDIFRNITDILAREIVTETKPNAFYLPQFKNDLIRVMKIMPLWTSVICSIDDKLSEVCTTSSVESEFKTLEQNVLKNHRPPLDIHIFIQLFINHVNAQYSLFEKNPITSEFVNFIYQPIKFYSYFNFSHSTKKQRGIKGL